MEIRGEKEEEEEEKRGERKKKGGLEEEEGSEPPPKAPFLIANAGLYELESVPNDAVFFPFLMWTFRGHAIAKMSKLACTRAEIFCG